MPPSPLLGRLKEIEARVAAAPGVLLISDFDGTLAPIVRTPEEASLPPSRRRLLAEVAGLERASVAVVSGRSLEDIRARVALEGLTYAGNHGLEISGPGLDFLEPRAAALGGVITEIGAALTAALQGVAGARVEDKRWTLSVHFRNVEPGRIEEVRRVVQDVLFLREAGALREAVRIREGKKVLEVVPRIAWDKGAASRLIREHLGAADAVAIAIGDDATDETMFRALADGVTIKVGKPDETSAAFFVAGPPEVESFLEWLVRAIRAGEGREGRIG